MQRELSNDEKERRYDFASPTGKNAEQDQTYKMAHRLRMGNAGDQVLIR